MKPIGDMTDTEFLDFFQGLARAVEAMLPPGPSTRGKCLYALIVADSVGFGVGQYVSNVNREDMVRFLRETAARLEGKEGHSR